MSIDNVIRFRSAEEFRARPAWRDGLDHSEHKLLRIIGDYSFSAQEALPCGLKGCRTSHQNGYVIETADGLETHIGNKCGKRYFDVNWGELKATFRRAEEDRDRQTWLNGMLNQRDELLQRAAVVLQNIAVASTEIDEIIEKIGKEPAIKSAFQTVWRSGGAIHVERQVDATTAELLDLSKQRRTSMEVIGRIECIEVAILAPEARSTLGTQSKADLKTLVLAPLNALSLNSLRNLNSRQRKARTRDLERAKERLANAESYLQRAQRFLLPSNLLQIARLNVYRPNQRAERILKHFGAMVER